MSWHNQGIKCDISNLVLRLREDIHLYHKTALSGSGHQLNV